MNWQEHQIIFDPIEGEREGTVGDYTSWLLDSTGDALEARFDYSSTQDDWIPIDTVLISQQRDYDKGFGVEQP